MKILRGLEDFKNYLQENDLTDGCLADTSFLYAQSYTDDRLYKTSLEVSDLLAEEQIPIYANVISRMEFIDLIFRKQITMGAVSLFGDVSSSSVHKDLFNLLKNIRDQDSSHRKDNKSLVVTRVSLVASCNELERIPQRFPLLNNIADLSYVQGLV